MNDVASTKKEDVISEIRNYFDKEPFYGSGNMMVKLTALGVLDEVYFAFSSVDGSFSEITDLAKCVASGAVHAAAILHKGQYPPKKPIHEVFGVDEDCPFRLWGKVCKAIDIERYM